MITRRIFLRDSGLAVVGTAAVPAFLRRAAAGAIGVRRTCQASRSHLSTWRGRRS